LGGHSRYLRNMKNVFDKISLKLHQEIHEKAKEYISFWTRDGFIFGIVWVDGGFPLRGSISRCYNTVHNCF